MNELLKILMFMVSCVLTHNFIFSRFLGNCPFLGVSNKVETAVGMGVAVTFVMALASLFTWLVYHLVLVKLGLRYLDTIAFILIIAGLVQFVEMFIKKSSPSLYKALGIYLPLITTNCAVLGVAVMNVQRGSGLLESTLFAFAAGVGFALALTIFTGLREKLDRADPPHAFRGVALALVTAGLLSLAFMGFSGLVK